MLKYARPTEIWFAYVGIGPISVTDMHQWSRFVSVSLSGNLFSTMNLGKYCSVVDMPEYACYH